ncbi:Ubiquitin fusion degradation protein 4 [Pyricularia oryzae]
MAERMPSNPPRQRSVVVENNHHHPAAFGLLRPDFPAPVADTADNEPCPSSSVVPAAPVVSGAVSVKTAPSSRQSPSSRITRSSVRHAANQAGPPPSTTPAPGGAEPVTAAPAASTPVSASQTSRATTRKRKSRDSNTSQPESPDHTAASRRPKRQKPVTESSVKPPSQSPAASTRSRKGKAPAAMSSPDPNVGPSGPPDNATSASSSRKSSRSKKNTQPSAESSTRPQSSAKRRTSQRPSKNDPDQDMVMTGTDEAEKAKPPPPPDPAEQQSGDDSDENDDDDDHRYDDDDDDIDPFGSFGGPPRGLVGGLPMLHTLMSGMGSRLRSLMANLSNKEDPSVQLIALQDLSEILLVSNEDNLSGHFSPDALVKELVALMQPHEITGEENPEIMLLACRCLANLMEALPPSVANVVYGGAVPVLCQKLLEISFIDLAEQALSTLEKISYEYPASIVREGGLTACLSYLEFFPTSTQRTAVTTAANCCRNITEDSFPVIKEVMPILLNVLNSSDQRVVEQASLCVSRIVESFRYYTSKLEELVSVDLLKAVLRLLLPGTTNLISPSIHTQFLRVLAHTARASPRLSAELFKLNIVETLYQILTGVSPPAGTDDVASKLDSVLIMQALIHRPREQIIETLNVICELLPAPIPVSAPQQSEISVSTAEPATPSSQASRKKTTNEKRVELLEDCKEQVRRFCLILFPTLTDAFSSTVNLTVRQKVLTAQLKMLSNLDTEILTEALKVVPYASFLASILSQQDHPSLVMYALHATELLMSRLDSVYRYQLYREGVITEITKLSIEEDKSVADEGKKPADEAGLETPGQSTASAAAGSKAADHDSDEENGDEDKDDDDEDDHDVDDDGEDGEDAMRSHHSSDDENDDENDNNHRIEEMSASPASSEGSSMSIDGPARHIIAPIDSMQKAISDVAKKFLETYETEKHSKVMKKKATKILDSLSALATDIEVFYLQRSSQSVDASRGVAYFKQLASYFDSDQLESVTSAELLASGLVRVLERVFSNPDESLAAAAQSDFLQVFMGYTVKSKPKTATADSPATPFSVMVHKLQDLLSRSEHFEVITVHQNALDGNRSSAASMLAKQIRLRLVADDDSDIPRAYRNIMVSIHAISTFKSLDDYLRPRISLSERPRNNSSRSVLSRAMAALAGHPGIPLEAAERLAARLPALAAGGSPFGGPSAGSSLFQPSQPSASRSARKPKAKSNSYAESPSTPDQASPTSRDKAVLRRSSRRQAASADTPPPPPPPEEEESLANALECADEKQLSDGDDMGEASALDAIVGELEEDMGDEPAVDPTAVNMEVAAGGKITARKDDGTRVPTPSQAAGSASTAPPSASGISRDRTSAISAAFQSLQGTPTPGGPSRPLSYAAAVQATPQDWHIEFSVDSKVIPNETTIYRAIHSPNAIVDSSVSRSVWSAVHSVKFRRVPGPPPTSEGSPFGASFEGAAGTVDENGTPASLSKHPATTSILRLLKMLHDLNANIDDVLVENKEALKLNIEPLSQFVNTKLTAKLNRQLEEPLIVASNCLPSWSEDLARQFPFLFPFETRHLFLQSTSFGYARSMTRWQNAQSQEESRRDRRDERPFLGRLQRQKVRISRSKILESAVKVMELYGANQSILEVEYFEEVGTGLGPTLEFYSTVSKEFSKKKLKLWRDADPHDSDEFVSSPNGLFPRPISEEDGSGSNSDRVLGLFKILGKFVARSMIDSRIIDINLNPIFFRIGDEKSGVKPSLGAVKMVDPALARSLMLIKKFSLAKKEIDEDPCRTPAQKVADTERITLNNISIEDLSLDFTLPGQPHIELIPNGAQINLTMDNVDLYLDKVIDMTLGSGVRRQVDAFRQGFSQVFPYAALSAFTPDELVSLFGRIDEDWSLETLMDSIKADHGYNMDSLSVKNLLQFMSELSPAERRDFLQFTTGSPKLPIGGFKSLNPMFTVVCKPSEEPYTSDDYLPSVMTCVNYLKLPNYTDINVLRKRMSTAMKEGQGAFHLS